MSSSSDRTSLDIRFCYALITNYYEMQALLDHGHVNRNQYRMPWRDLIQIPVVCRLTFEWTSRFLGTRFAGRTTIATVS